MHIITIACPPVALEFVFKTKETAEKACSNFNAKADSLTITDDFGKTGVFFSKDISCWAVEDCDLSKRAHIERALHQQRTQTEFQKLAESDPIIRGAMRGGPAILSPVPGFNGRGN